MKYIGELLKVSNDELAFAKELAKIKEDMINHKKTYLCVKSFLTNVERYCDTKLELSESINSNCVLLNTNDFCMFILNRIFNEIKEDFKIKEEAIKRQLRVKTLPSCAIDSFKQQFIETIFFIMTNGFAKNTEYYFDKMDDSDNELFMLYNMFLKKMNLDIVIDIIKTKPLIFIGRKGHPSSILTGLNILLLNIEDMVKHEDSKKGTMYIYNQLINNITEIVMNKLFREILTDSDIDNLCNTYSIKKEDLWFKIGENIADYIIGSMKIKTGLLNDVIKIANENLEKEYLIEKKQIEMVYGK